MSTTHHTRTHHTRGHALVVGAGVVGIATALWLQRHGWRVTLLDRQLPGTATSFGNACTFATYSVEPVATPGIWRQAPALLLKPDSPLKVRPAYLGKIAPWLWQFLRHSSEQRVHAISRDLDTLLKPCMSSWGTLLDDAQANHLIRHDGSLYIFETHERRVAEEMVAYHLPFEVPIRLVENHELHAMEPALNARAALGVELPGVSRTLDPYALSLCLFQRFLALGGRFERGELRDIHRSSAGGEQVSAVLASGQTLTAERVALCTGAWSKQLAKSLGDELPQDTERGYHVLFEQAGAVLNRPVCWGAGGFYMTPMAQGLRVAGTVEFAGTQAAPDPRRYRYLANGARRFLNLQHEPASQWMGFRSSMPDSKPVVGQSRLLPQVFYNFGHGHVGLTLGAVTGQLLAEMASGLQTSVPLAPFSPHRFG
ncbi:FAD-binding oxidoreductase [Pseudomonas sp. GV071]|uniref:NAD(P)/FAD-dependent oxidoreductase n=1 Tax=Pseudomonas sp. GV071 TaxID=2135754 RepID=UPI000D38C903|nr:FAD-binding oxidoreductase [Pseudomonas sp. GV071]PTQ70062.1 D-amino-acid dehydrogenase [Pseudomonas sp. GV071]